MNNILIISHNPEKKIPVLFFYQKLVNIRGIRTRSNLEVFTMSMMSKWFVYVLFTYFCSTADVKTLNCDSDICKYEGEGVYILDRVVPLTSLKFLRFPNAQLILQREMVPNLKSIMINDKTDCACKHFHVPQDIKINIGGRMCPVSY